MGFVIFGGSPEYFVNSLKYTVLSIEKFCIPKKTKLIFFFVRKSVFSQIKINQHQLRIFCVNHVSRKKNISISNCLNMKKKI